MCNAYFWLYIVIGMYLLLLTVYFSTLRKQQFTLMRGKNNLSTSGC